MSASPSQAPAEQESGESLEDTYVHLTTRLLLQLQQRDIPAALQTADVVRALCLGNASPSSAASPAPQTPGEELFRGSPAEMLLHMRNDLAMPLARQQQPPTEDDASEVSATSSGTPSTSSDDTNSTSDGSVSSEEEEDDAVHGYAATATAVSDGPHLHHLQQQQQQFESLASALTKWSHMRSPSPVKPADPRWQPTKTGVPQPSPPQALRPTPPLAAAQKQQQQQRWRPVQKGSGSQPCDAPEGGEERGIGPEAADAEAEAEETWQRMQQQVAQEMERLAVVRKHR